MRWTDAVVREALGLAGPALDREYRRVSTDTRSIGPGDLFVALTGEHFDGHTFLESAREAGAPGAVVKVGTGPVPGLVLYPVDDPLVALGRLARARRRTIRGPVVAVTGTNGKTSTKAMLAAAVATRYRVHATRANLNNLVGVPTTILEAPEDVEALVVEAGASLPGEIARYRAIIEPDLSVITNVTAGHLEGFGSLDAILSEKLSLARDVPIAVVGVDDGRLAAGARRVARRVVTAGLADADVVPDRWRVTADGRTELEVGGHRWTLGLLGLHQAKNAMLVFAAARELQLDLGLVARALEGITLPPGRGQLLQQGALTILNDSYNANPASFRSVIELTQVLRRGRRLVFVAGTMLELGEDSDRLHQEIAAELLALEPELLVGVGEFARLLAPHAERLGERVLIAPDVLALAGPLAARLAPTDLVVLKGSRGMAMERIIPELLKGVAP